ncbi:MAG: sugar ABC transporter permease [Candidatus Enteromonas sp.]|nr:sugar ABC transporter permease [Candidatus Enteromonas sp.]
MANGFVTVERKKKKLKISHFYLFILPWLVALICFTLIPMIMSLVLSFTNAKASTISTKPLQFIGFKNYIDIFTTDDIFIRSIKNSFIYAFLKVAITLVIAFFVALLLNKKMKLKKLNNFFKVCVYLPAIIPAASNALLWQVLVCQDKSFFMNIFSSLGFGSIDFRAQPVQAMLVVTLINVIGAVGPWMIVIISSLQNVSQDLIEASELDGASKTRQLFSVIIPSISPQLFFLLTTGLINTIQAYTEITLLFGSNLNTYTMTMRIMDNAFSGAGMGYACALAWIVFLIVSIFTFVFFKTIGRKVYYGSENN